MITVIGSFVADLTARTPHMPVPGETVLGKSFKLGPGGKGGNQATAAARAGSQVNFITNFKVDVVDTTGAGDAFNGGFAHALDSGMDIDKAVRFASAVAGLSVTRFGTAPAMPASAEIHDFLKGKI
jgi:sugar/nucleoside kinase (ribokinase family)